MNKVLKNPFLLQINNGLWYHDHREEMTTNGQSYNYRGTTMNYYQIYRNVDIEGKWVFDTLFATTGGLWIRLKHLNYSVGNQCGCSFTFNATHISLLLKRLHDNGISQLPLLGKARWISSGGKLYLKFIELDLNGKSVSYEEFMKP
mgnify:CR=1 FL=1